MISVALTPSSSGRFTPPRPNLSYLGSGTSNLGKFSILNYDPSLIYSLSGNGSVSGNIVSILSSTASVALSARSPKGLSNSPSRTAEVRAPDQGYVVTVPFQCYNSGSCASQCGGCGTYYEPGNPVWNGVGGFWSCCDQGFFFFNNYSGSYNWGGSNYTNGAGQWWRIT